MSETETSKIDLREQARAIRAGQRPVTVFGQRGTGFWISAGLRILIAFALVISAVALIWSQSARQRTALWIVRAADYYGGTEQPVESVAAVRRGPVAPKVSAPGVRIPSGGSTTQPGSTGVQAPSWVILSPEERGGQPEPAQAMPSGDEGARAMALLKKDATVQKLMANQISGYQYVSMAVQGQQGDSILIAVATRFQGEVRRLIWEVNLANSQVQPISYEAKRIGQ